MHLTGFYYKKILYGTFSYMFQLMRAIINDNPVQKQIPTKTLVYILTGVHSSRVYQTWQQVLCKQYTCLLKLEGLKY